MLTIWISILNTQFGLLFSYISLILCLGFCFFFFSTRLFIKRVNKIFLSMTKSVYLQVGHSHCCDHSKHNEEHASNNRLWDGDKNCSKFSKYSQDDHQNASCLDDQSAANLGGGISMKVD